MVWAFAYGCVLMLNLLGCIMLFYVQQTVEHPSPWNYPLILLNAVAFILNAISAGKRGR